MTCSLCGRTEHRSALVLPLLLVALAAPVVLSAVPCHTPLPATSNNIAGTHAPTHTQTKAESWRFVLKLYCEISLTAARCNSTAHVLFTALYQLALVVSSVATRRFNGQHLRIPSRQPCRYSTDGPNYSKLACLSLQTHNHADAAGGATVHAEAGQVGGGSESARYQESRHVSWGVPGRELRGLASWTHP